jgi:PEP-CTERM motif
VAEGARVAFAPAGSEDSLGPEIEVETTKTAKRPKEEGSGVFSAHVETGNEYSGPDHFTFVRFIDFVITMMGGRLEGARMRRGKNSRFPETFARGSFLEGCGPFFRSATHPMKTLILPVVLACFSSAHAATVLSNLGDPVSTVVLVKGTGGFISNPIEVGFEFTVASGDHYLDSVTFSIGTHQGTVPLTVELYSSPTGPDNATFLTTMTGPAQPVNQLATYTPAVATTLTNGGTYFVRLWVNGAASNYGVEKTAGPATGVFAMGNHYQRNGGSPWGAGSNSSELRIGIDATAVPEPSAMLLCGAGFVLALRRRRA